MADTKDSDLLTETDPLLTSVGLSFDAVLERSGAGLFHVILTLVAGWALASDSVEVQSVSFVIPKLDNDTTARPTKVVRFINTGKADSRI